MIIKGRKIPLIILYKEALLRRIPQNSPHRPKIKEDLLKYWSGYHGECKVDRHLSTLSQKNVLILNDLQIPIGKTTFQIDSLLIFKSVALILEVKNISGMLNIGGEFNQFSRTNNDGIITGFTNPISQAERYSHHLRQWLKANGFAQLPVDYLVVFTNPSSVLNGLPNSKQFKQRVIKVADLLKKLSEIQTDYPKTVLCDRDAKKAAKKLLKAHIDPPIFTKIEETILTGVQCVNCRTFGMERKKASWYCNSCGSYDKQAHVQAIFDYFLLVNPKISNKQARSFLHVNSSKVVHGILNSMRLNSQGENKNKQYVTPFHSV
ncbi:NERD domain-containing protein [Rossellomorea aquimaris]|uniref:nuclease-related domain-containing protein n=1 Tax=Rossellomorea aquimaris TaxID=189382 RepID=UPI001CD5070E|nr:nuclease-related domain-containing protein [Rossellomorea aquimaris]MCA1056603.1 NERD domain-containing protein [Rossellomorea aquimaris]